MHSVEDSSLVATLLNINLASHLKINSADFSAFSIQFGHVKEKV